MASFVSSTNSSEALRLGVGGLGGSSWGPQQFQQLKRLTPMQESSWKKNNLLSPILNT